MEGKLRMWWQDDTVFISWLLVARQWPDSLRFNIKSLHHQSDPHDYCEISRSSAVILDVHNRTQTPAKEEHAGKRRHIGALQIHMHIHMHNCTHCYILLSHADLVDWQWFVRFNCIYLCTPHECTSQFSSKLKAFICHPVQSKFNASNYRGSASRQIWSEEAWQESLLRIRAF